MIEYLFPEKTKLMICDVQVQAEKVDIYAHRSSIYEACPDCQQQSAKIHSHYQRHPYDLPCLGYRVQLHLQVRRFFCKVKKCKRKTFAETFPELVGYRARRTQRLCQQQLEIAFAVSSEAGNRLLPVLAMPLSGDTLIRDIRAVPEEEVTTPRVLGIDDWAKKRGQTYGTIMVDLESRQPIDVLNSTEIEDVADWLKLHPGIEIISRDRGLAYIKAATLGAPEAQQVADRWHLLKNLREAVETMLNKKPAVLAAAGQINQNNEIENVETAVLTESSGEETTNTSVAQCMTKVEQDKAARHARRQARYDLVNQLYQEGYSLNAIEKHLEMSWRTVRKYVEAESCPQYPTGRFRPSKLDPWLPYLEERWQAGYTNATQLWREIDAQGFPGSRNLVSRWAAKERKLLPKETQYSRQQPQEVQPKLNKQTRPIPWSASRASWILVKERSLLDDREKAALSRMEAADAQVKVIAHLAERFVTMVKQQKVEKLQQWLNDAVATGVRSFISLANGLRQDFAAVSNGLSLIWSSGQVEGQINRLKNIKRMMYGRANFDLLRKRVLHQL